MDRLGRVIAVAGAQMTARLETDEPADDAVRIGAMVKARGAVCDVVGTVAAIQLENGGPSVYNAIVVDLLGEIATAPDGRAQFSRGVSRYPVAGAAVWAATETDLTAVYARPSATHVSIGSLDHDARRQAFA